MHGHTAVLQATVGCILAYIAILQYNRQPTYTIMADVLAVIFT